MHQYPNLTLEGIKSKQIREVCEETYAKFVVLHGHELVIRKRKLKRTTMQAQPVFDLRFFTASKRRYRIDICNKTTVNKQLDIRELPREVLQGWLAHEMGHVVDYIARSGINLLRFGFSYLTSGHFRVGAERMADLYAIEYGFGEEVLATKKFILKEAGLPKSYLNRIERFYMSPEELELILAGESKAKVAFDQPELRPWDKS